jgi:hypothetical protein
LATIVAACYQKILAAGRAGLFCIPLLTLSGAKTVSKTDIYRHFPDSPNGCTTVATGRLTSAQHSSRRDFCAQAPHHESAVPHKPTVTHIRAGCAAHGDNSFFAAACARSGRGLTNSCWSAHIKPHRPPARPRLPMATIAELVYPYSYKKQQRAVQMAFYAFYVIAIIVLILHFTGWLKRNNLEWLVLAVAVAVFPVVIFLR